MSSMCMLHFLLMFGWGFVAAGRDGFFIKQIGPDKLPYLYISNSLIIIIVTNLYSQVVDRVSRYSLFVYLLVVSAIGVVGLRSIIPLGIYWLPFVLYFFSELVFQILILMHFWTIANDVFNPREGKRVFPIIGGAGLAGLVCGGILTPIVVSAIGTSNLFLLWSVLLLLTIPSVLRVRNVSKSAGIVGKTDTIQWPESSKGLKGNAVQGLKDIWASPIIRCLTYAAVPSWTIANIIDYQFFLTMDELIPDQDRLTGFLGVLNSAFYAAGIILQLFFTSRLLNRFGVGATLLIYPISVTFGSLMLCLRSFLTPNPAQSIFGFRSISAIVASFSDDGIDRSIAGSTYQLLFNAIPENKRGRSRAFIMGMVEPIGLMLSGVCLIVLLKFGASELFLSLVLLALCVTLFSLTVKIKSEYLHALVHNLGSTSLELRSTAITALSNAKSHNSLSVLLEGITSENEDEALYALEIIQKREIKDIFHSLCNNIDQINDAVKIPILSMIGENKSNTVGYLGKIRHLLADTSPKIQAAAIKTIGKLGVYEDIRRIERFANDSNLEVRSEAVIALLKWNIANENKVLDAEGILMEMVQSTDRMARAKAAYIVGDVETKGLLHVLLGLSNSDHESVVEEVAKASGKIKDESLVPVLIGFLNTERYTHEVIRAIVNIGDVAIKSLDEALGSNAYNPIVKRHILYCLGKIGTPACIPAISNFLITMQPSIACERTGVAALTLMKAQLFQTTQNHKDKKLKHQISKSILPNISQKLMDLSQSIENQYFYLTSLKSIGNRNAVVLLIDALSRFIKKQEEVAFGYLELISDPLLTRTAAQNLRSKDYRVRSEALEILEGSCSEAKKLVDVLETIYLDKPSRTPLELVDLFRKLLKKGYHPWLRVCTIYSIGELRLAKLNDYLLKYYKDNRNEYHNPVIKNHVLNAMIKLGFNKMRGFNFEDIQALDRDMKRVIFLRGISLFSDIDGSDLRWISAIGDDRVYEKGDIIFTEDDEGESFYLIEAGSVRLVSEKNNRATVGVFNDGECFGELSIFNNDPRYATAEAVDRTTVLRINRQDFEDVLLSRPTVMVSLIKTLNQRLRVALNKLSDN